jgi:hypothetical protein
MTVDDLVNFFFGFLPLVIILLDALDNCFLDLLYFDLTIDDISNNCFLVCDIDLTLLDDLNFLFVFNVDLDLLDDRDFLINDLDLLDDWDFLLDDLDRLDVTIANDLDNLLLSNLNIFFVSLDLLLNSIVILL